MFKLIILLEIYYFLSSRLATMLFISNVTFIVSIILYNKPKKLFSLVYLLYLPLLSFIALFFYDSNFQQYLNSYINFYMTIINAILFINFITSYHLEQKFLNYFINISLILVFIGVLQFLHLINIEGARTYITSSYSFAIQSGINIRTTSIFSEPSAFALYLSISYICAFYLKRKFSMYIIVFGAIISLSLTAYFVFSILFILLYFKINLNFIIKTFIYLVIVGLIIIISPFSDFIYFMWDRVSTGSFGAYRINALIFAIYDTFTHGLLSLSGMGLGQISILLEPYSLGEQANTTHTMIADIILENGVYGVVVFFLFLFSIYKMNKTLLLLFIVIAFPSIGYRSSSFVLIISVIYAIYFLKKEKNEKNNYYIRNI